MAAAAFNYKKVDEGDYFWLHKLKPANTGLTITFLKPDTMVINVPEINLSGSTK